MKSPNQVALKSQDKTQTNISRKEALEKMGKYSKYSALTAIGSFVILNPKKAQATSVDC